MAAAVAVLACLPESRDLPSVIDLPREAWVAVEAATARPDTAAAPRVRWNVTHGLPMEDFSLSWVSDDQPEPQFFATWSARRIDVLSSKLGLRPPPSLVDLRVTYDAGREAHVETDEAGTTWRRFSCGTVAIAPGDKRPIAGLGQWSGSAPKPLTVRSSVGISVTTPGKQPAARR